MENYSKCEFENLEKISMIWDIKEDLYDEI